MRVGIYIGKIQEATSGGGATFQSSILDELAQIKSEHEFYVLYDNAKRLFEDNENIKFINMDVKKIKKRSLFRKIFKKSSKEPSASLNETVLEHNIELVWFLVPIYHFVEAPFVLTVWDLAQRRHPYFPEVSLSGWTFDQREAFYKNAIPKASYVVIGNSEGSKQIQTFYNVQEERIKPIALPTPQYVWNQNEDDSILERNNLEKGKFLFYPAQFWPHKNHIRLVKTMKILKEEGSDFKLVFTGADKGNELYIKEKVKQYGLENEIKFLGFVSEKELISLYKNTFALVFPSFFDPDNLPPLEAMALNCPVLCSDTKGMRIQLGDCALYFDPKNELDIVEKINQLLKDDSLKNALVSKGQILVKNCSTKKYVEEMIKVVEEFAPLRECWSNTEKYIHL